MEETVKIYSHAGFIINLIMAELYEKRRFSASETAWKAIEVKHDLVVFTIHQRIKDLLETTMIAFFPDINQDGSITFTVIKDAIWKAEVKADGAESYFFARMLFSALWRLKKQATITEINCRLLRLCLNTATLKILDGCDHNFSVRYIGKVYKLSINIGAMHVTSTDQNADKLCRWIGSQLRGNFGLK